MLNYIQKREIRMEQSQEIGVRVGEGIGIVSLGKRKIGWGFIVVFKYFSDKREQIVFFEDSCGLVWVSNVGRDFGVIKGKCFNFQSSYSRMQ